MDDAERIGRITAKLAQAWTLTPKWRLGQLVGTLLSQEPVDATFVPDERLEAILDDVLGVTGHGGTYVYQSHDRGDLRHGVM